LRTIGDPPPDPAPGSGDERDSSVEPLEREAGAVVVEHGERERTSAAVDHPAGIDVRPPSIVTTAPLM
jgi:hypothetical protein